MRQRNISSEFVNALLEGNEWQKFGIKVGKKKSLTESTEETVNEEEEHVCPLCESKLDEAISEDRLQEHINEVMNLVNEMNESSDDEDEDEDSPELQEAYQAIQTALDSGDLTEADVKDLTKDDVLAMLADGE